MQVLIYSCGLPLKRPCSRTFVSHGRIYSSLSQRRGITHNFHLPYAVLALFLILWSIPRRAEDAIWASLVIVAIRSFYDKSYRSIYQGEIQFVQFDWPRLESDLLGTKRVLRERIWIFCLWAHFHDLPLV